MDRGCGIYLPISKLYNKYGYGCFSKEAYDFIDYISNLKIKYWQIEPINLYDDFECKKLISSFAGNPLFLDIEKFLTTEEIEFFKLNNNLSYDDYKSKKNEVLKYVFDKMYYSTNIDKFIENNEYWVYDYAVYMALKDELKSDYNDFPDEYKNIDSGETIMFIKTHSDEIIYYIFIQYLFYKQWKELKKYANLRGVKIIVSNDLKISDDSSDLYANRKLFYIKNDDKKQVLYNFDNIKKDNYKYFIDRYKWNSSLYDYIIINYDNNIDVENFNQLANKLLDNYKSLIFDNNCYDEKLSLIKFDFKVKYFIKNMAYGFVFNDKDSLPNNYQKKTIGYLGFKDCESLTSFLKDEIFLQKISNYLNLSLPVDKSTIIKMAIENIIISNADVCIIHIQDILLSDINGNGENTKDLRIKKNYQDERLFLYLKELIKNKNR